jgi:hypothetical protein
VVIFITLIAGFVPLLQVTFFVLLEDFYPGRLAMKDRDKAPRITGVILIKLFLKKVSSLGNKSFAFDRMVEGIPKGLLWISYKDAFSALVSSLSGYNFFTYASQPQTLRNDNLGFLPCHSSYGVVSTKQYQQVGERHHGPYTIQQGAVMLLRHAVTLRCSSWRTLWHNSTCPDMCLKLKTKILASSVRTKLLDLSIELIFDLFLKFLELSKVKYLCFIK